MARKPPPPASPAPPTISLDREVAEFSTDEQIALGDLQIRRAFAERVTILFVAANAFVLAALSGVFVMDCIQISAHAIKPSERIISGQVIMALLGATTVQLGTVIITITRAIFPGSRKAAGAAKSRSGSVESDT